jgi:hypothetical protein
LKSCNFCEKEFTPKSKNQKYCDSECCRKATNKKIMKKYYENKERLKGKARNCKKCNLPLSRYNPLEICYECDKKSKRYNEEKFKKALGYVTNQAK